MCANTESRFRVYRDKIATTAAAAAALVEQCSKLRTHKYMICIKYFMDVLCRTIGYDHTIPSAQNEAITLSFGWRREHRITTYNSVPATLYTYELAQQISLMNNTNFRGNR